MKRSDKDNDEHRDNHDKDQPPLQELVLLLAARLLRLMALAEPAEAASHGANGKVLFASSRTMGQGVDNPEGALEIGSTLTFSAWQRTEGDENLSLIVLPHGVLDSQKKSKFFPI